MLPHAVGQRSGGAAPAPRRGRHTLGSCHPNSGLGGHSGLVIHRGVLRGAARALL